MPKLQPVWAIDVGQAAIKALKLVPGDDPDKVTAEAFDFVEYPKILSQPDADPEELVREALTTFLERNDLKGCKVAIGVPGQAGLVKTVKLPPVEKSRIPDIVKFEARQHIPFALEEVIWDYQQIGGGGGDEDEEEFSMVEVGLFAMKRDQINRAIQPLKAAGIEVDIVQMSPIALFNYLSFDDPPAEGEADAPHAHVLLDIGADNTDLIITDGKRIWQRNVPIGGNHFTRALTKELKLTFAKAEHLKRNAQQQTKDQDPKAVFAAMRGVFNDLASEVNRSIGFYSSVNRQAKIDKIVGLGNGFKLPGMQTFLQKNLNYEVQKLKEFNKLVGDEVTTAPQFKDNLMSFAVAYGLGLQGLGKSVMRTNLLPPEIEQVRMVRRKKPWALAASTLLMLGLSAMFVSAWGALEKTRPLVPPAKQAKSVADQGTKYEADYNAAKGSFESLKKKGETLVSTASSGTDWPALLQTVMATLPNPARELAAADPGFDPAAPANIPIVGMRRVHVDRVVPVYRKDLKTEWFDQIEPRWKNSMHPYDRDNPPSGEGWVVQVFAHHYNPSKLSKGLGEAEKKHAMGPMLYLETEVLPRFWQVPLRLAGIHHAALTWFYPDTRWTTDKGASAVPPPPLLARATPQAKGGGGGPTDMQAMMAGGAGRNMMAPGVAMGGSSGGMSGMEGMMASGGMSGMMGGRGAMMAEGGLLGAPGKSADKDMTYLTRTDFKIEFVFQPPKPQDQPKDDAERLKKFEEIKKAMDEAKSKAGAVSLDEGELAKASAEQSLKAFTAALEQAKQEIQAAQGGTSPDAAAQPAATAPADQPPPQ
jgi:type IV pilus assembly protein PilM